MISHLPEERQDELDKIVSLVRAKTNVEKIILFGSHARGDWVSDVYSEGHITYTYKSDYDLLIVVENEDIKNNFDLWRSLEKEISSVTKLTVNLIVDTINFVNKKIQESNYFYLDIQKEGVTLYDSNKFSLAVPQARSKDLMQMDFDFWYGKALSFLKDFHHNLADGELNNAAFHLSQVTESLYFAVLLVAIGYKPKTHNIEKISELAEKLDPEIKGVFLFDTEENKLSFELLKRAYIDARYRQDYNITKEQLIYLESRIQILFSKVKSFCEKIILTA